MAAIDRLLNEHPTEKVKYIGDQGWRIIKGLIAAKLNQNKKYEELRVYYKNYIVEGNTNSLQKYGRNHLMYDKCIKTIDFLDTHSFEELQKIANG